MNQQIDLKRQQIYIKPNQYQKHKMILPHEYVKLFEDHRKDKRLVHSEKTLKNRLKSLLPNQASIKLFYSQHGKNINESSLLKLYRFEQIPKFEYERILSNPLYFLENERNLRMFRFYLLKNGYSQNRSQDQIKAKSRKASLISNTQTLMNYQFTDKTKINYQQPWKYIESTIKKMQEKTKGNNRKLSVEFDTKRLRKSSEIITFKKINPKNSEKDLKFQEKGLCSPKICKSLSTSFILKIKERQENTSKIKQDLFKRDLQKSNLSRVNFHSKILESEVRVKKMKENSAMERNKMNSMVLLKTQRFNSQKKMNEELGPEIKRHLSELKKVCVRTAYEKSQSVLDLNPVQKLSKQFIPVNRLKEIKLWQHKEMLRNMLQKRLGIEDSNQKKLTNPEKAQK